MSQTFKVIEGGTYKADKLEHGLVAGQTLTVTDEQDIRKLARHPGLVVLSDEPVVAGDAGDASDAGDAGDDRAELEAMKVDELKALAAESNVDLGDATKKDDIIDAILAALDEGEGDDA